MPLYLYKEIDDYLKAGGIDGTGGVYDGEKLMAVTLRRPDGVISLSTWNIVQHECFHQFIHAAVGNGNNVPMWADEGLAEYFGQGLFTGDDFEVGLIPNTRLIRLQAMLKDRKHSPLARFTALTREQWNQQIEMRNYDQAWSLVHFLAHADDARLRPAFENYMRDVSRGGDPAKAFARHLGPAPDLEARWRDWWLALPDHPTGDLYDRATLEILTSFLARAHAAGQRFDSFDAFARTPPADLRQPDDRWLPPTLFGMAVAESHKIRAMAGAFALVRTAEGPPALLLATPNGARLTGRFTLSPTNTPQNIRVETLAPPHPRKPPVTRPTTHPGGEMLK
jgi:hypothetical protein